MRQFQSVVLLCVLMAAGGAWGQTSASHTISVRIPNVLRLRVGEGAGASRADMAVRVRVHEGAYRIDPAATEVQVLANSSWQLGARYVPASERDAAAKLLWKLDDSGWRPFARYDQQIAYGGPTSGWQSLQVVYGLETPLPPDGSYQGVITYTLTRP